MASLPLSRRSQSAVPQTNSKHALSMDASQSATTPSNDPLQPLRAMADRVGKEVEKFAERVDHWHTHGNEDENAKYHTTVKMVGKFKDLAESTVKELKKQNNVDNQGELDKSVRRRIETIAAEPTSTGENLLGRSFYPVVPSIESSAPSEPSSVLELRQWQEELATWELMRVVVEHHHPEPDTDVAAEKAARLNDVGGESRYCPKSEIWDRFIVADDAAREKKVILKWLQQTAKNTESDIQSIIDQWGKVSGKDTETWTSGWLDTKSKIKQAKLMQGLDRPLDADHVLQSKGGVHPLTTRLDPDAPARQKRALEESDEYYENALWMVCYEMLRRGESWESISDWCKERNEAWRGVSIGAAYTSQVDGAPNLAGNDVGYLFRRMCFYASRGARIPYEGAVYALLSGDLKQVQPACRSWNDHLYAHYNALLLSRFDGYLRQTPRSSPWVHDTWTQKFVFQDAVANFSNWETTNKQVIDLLERDATTSAQAKLPMKLIQGALISGTVGDLTYKVGIAIADLLAKDDRIVNLVIDPDTERDDPTSKQATEQRAVSAEDHHQILAKDPHALRILVHVFIALRNGLCVIDIDSRPKVYAMNNVIAAYIEFLRITKRLQLIPLYAAQFGPFRSAHCMARILPDIKNHDEQKRCISLMQQYRINVIEVLNDNFHLMLQGTGLVSATTSKVVNPVTKFELVEAPRLKDSYLWPGVRVKKEMSGLDISPEEEALIESLQWYNHLDQNEEHVFRDLYSALLTFLLNGRMGAAEKLVTEMSVETISLSKTAVYCGYAFDFTQAGAEEQDEDQVAESMRSSLRSSANESVRPSEVPSAQEHARHVQRLRQLSQEYHDISHVVRLVTLFRQWREEEEKLISSRSANEQISTKRIKELFATIEATFSLLLDPSYDPTSSNQLWGLYRAYLPELIIAYLSILQAGSFFIHRDSATKAMDLATVLADGDREWLQKVFLQTGRMSELVTTLANVSKAMLRLGEHGDGKTKIGKRRGSKGETLRIWDLNVRTR